MAMLKLQAFEPDDLTVVAALVQDAILTVGDIHRLAKERAIAIALNRFAWETGGEDNGGERRRSVLRISRIERARSRNIRQSAKDAVLSLLTVSFEPGATEPSGDVVLTFAGGGEMRITVECIEVEVADLGPSWSSGNVPHHSDDATPEGNT